MKTVVFIIFLISACGREPEIDPTLRVYLDHYLRFAPNKGKLDKLESLKFESVIDKGELGVCDIEKRKFNGIVYDEVRSIKIDPIGDGQRPIVLTVYHELGHCLNDLPHTTGVHDIMNSVREGSTDHWTSEEIDNALTNMFMGARAD